MYLYMLHDWVRPKLSNISSDYGKNEKMSILNLIVIRASEPERLVDFYSTLGLSFEIHKHGSKGAEHFACEMGSSVFEIYPKKHLSENTTATRLGFSVSSLDETISKLRSLGSVVSEPKDSPWGRRVVVCDFEGHKVELTESATLAV